MKKYIPMNECKGGYLYEVECRNGRVGIYNAKQKGFIISRHKFGSNFVFIEFHWDTGEPHGTACPLREIEKAPDFGPANKLLETNNKEVLDYLNKKTEEATVYYECLDKDCERGKKLDKRHLIWFENIEGKTVFKCPYCRGKVKELK